MRNTDKIKSAVSKIRLLSKRHDLVIAVEGIDDHRTYQQIFIGDVVFAQCHGKPNVVEALKLIEPDDNVNNCFGITDNDYDDRSNENAFTIQTDFTDLESFSIWLAEDCVKTQLLQLIDPEKLQNNNLTFEEIYEISLMRSTDLGSIRCHNDLNNLGVTIANTKKKHTNNFKRISNLSTKAKQSGLKGVVDRIVQLNDDVQFATSYYSDVESVRNQYSQQQLIKGGDLVEAFIEVSKSVGVLVGSCNAKLVANTIRGCLTFEKLKGTELFKNIYDRLSNQSLQHLVKMS